MRRSTIASARRPARRETPAHAAAAAHDHLYDDLGWDRRSPACSRSVRAHHTELTVSPDRNPPFMLMSDGSVRNSYTLQDPQHGKPPARHGDRGRGPALRSCGPCDQPRRGLRQPAGDSTSRSSAGSARLCRRAGWQRTAAFSFRVTSLDEQRETDVVETRISMHRRIMMPQTLHRTGHGWRSWSPPSGLWLR